MTKPLVTVGVPVYRGQDRLPGLLECLTTQSYKEIDVLISVDSADQASADGQSGFQAVSSNPNRRWWEYDISDVFIRMLPADLNAAVGLAQLRRLNELQARRRVIWERYQAAFAEIDAVRTPADAAPDERHSYFTYFIRIPDRDRVARALLRQEIYTTLRFHPLHLNRKYGSSASLPNAETLNETGLNIPLHPRLSDDDVERVIAAIVALVR